MAKKNILEEIEGMSPVEKEELIRKIGQTAYNNEEGYGGCSQSALAALQQHLGLEDPAVFKAASALAAGMGRTGESACGALVSGVMVIGLVYGRDKMSENTDESPSYVEAQRRAGILYDRFREQYDGFKCHDVQKAVFGRSLGMRDPEEFARLPEDIHTKCAGVVRKAAELATEVILEPAEPE